MNPVAPPLSVTEHPERCIEQLLNTISERDAQINLLQMQLQNQIELCNLHADRAVRAETAMRTQLLADPAPWPPNLSPADLAALNALPPAERDAAWLQRVFARGHASPPVGPYEVAGLYVDAFFWSGSAARPDAIVAAVARVFPGVELVPTECGPRFRGLARAMVAPALARVAQMPMEPVVAFGPAAGPPPSSRPASAPGYATCAASASTGKRKQSPDASLLQPEVTSKRVRSAHGPTTYVEDPPGAGNRRALSTAVQEQPQSFNSVAPQPAAVPNPLTDAATQACAAERTPDNEPLRVPALAGQPVQISPLDYRGARDDRGAQR